MYPTTARRLIPRSSIVLLVEENDAARALCSDALIAGGYGVIATRSGLEALTTFWHDPERIALLVADVSLPGMDGWALAGHVRRGSPALPVILLAAWTGAHERRALTGARPTLVPKPVAPAELLAHVEAAVPAP